jgi:hypothetical protein
MSTPYGKEIDRASQGVISYRFKSATTLHQYPWHGSAILQPETFVDWVSQNNGDGDMKDVIKVRLLFSTYTLADFLFRH